MPRKSKEETIIIDETETKKATKTAKKTTAKKTSAKKETTKKVATKKDSTKKSTSKKSTSVKATSKKVAEPKKTPSKKTSTTSTKAKKITKSKTEKEEVKKEKAKKTTAVKPKIAATKTTAKTKTPSQTKKTTTKTSSTKSQKKTATKTTKDTKTKKETAKTTRVKKSVTKTKKETTKKIEILEYYDLPYRYNETVVKILAQTPTTLFVYWDISDSDKEQYIKQYGTYFFNNTKPVLIVHNKTKNYSFEVDINDFANSWYLHILDGSNCDFQVELGRRPINNYVEIANNYLYITTSNNIISQNDHILFDRLSHIVYFRNVKSNRTYGKKITNLSLLQKIGKFDINFIKEFYKKLYPDENISFDKLDLRNPSSGNPTSTFK